MSSYKLASEMLAVVVPLRIMELRGMDPAEHARMIALWTNHEYVEREGVFSEDVLFRNRRDGSTARAFNQLGRTLAALAFSPGGISAFGQHWEATAQYAEKG
jgi:phosphopantothenate synthetase